MVKKIICLLAIGWFASDGVNAERVETDPRFQEYETLHYGHGGRFDRMEIKGHVPRHYSIAAAEDGVKRDSEIYPSPCNYSGGQGAVAECFHTEDVAIQAFFDRMPAKLRRRKYSRAYIARFKRQQAAFERRVDRRCRDVGINAQGSGSGVLVWGCYYKHYHPRFLRLKRFLGEPHPVRRRNPTATPAESKSN